jgi:hypothetical protein
MPFPRGTDIAVCTPRTNTVRSRYTMAAIRPRRDVGVHTPHTTFEKP